MKNLKHIVRREYLTRVKKKSFILTTLLTPLALGLFIFVLGFIMNYDDDEKNVIAVVDKSGIFNKPADLAKSGNTSFELTDATVENLRENFETNDFSAILYIPEIKPLRKKTIRFRVNHDFACSPVSPISNQGVQIRRLVPGAR